jgi:hypothetical protein
VNAPDGSAYTAVVSVSEPVTCTRLRHARASADADALSGVDPAHGRAVCPASTLDLAVTCNPAANTTSIAVATPT